MREKNHLMPLLLGILKQRKNFETVSRAMGEKS